MDAAELLRVQARANRLANLRLHGAMAALSDAELHAPRTSFFPSLMLTLNHILGVDLYYVGALCGETDGDEAWDRFQPAATLAALAERQRASDERLIAACDACTNFDAEVRLPRGGGRIQRDRVGFMLQHLFSHQVHHRGQVHAMLSGTRVAPPQLDEFIMPSEPHLRGAEMAELGWNEAAVYGARPYN